MDVIYNLEHLTSQQKLLLPKDKDIEFYEQNGWYVSEKIIPENLIDAAKKGALEFYNGKIDFNLKNTTGIANDKYDVSSAVRNNEFVTLQKKELKELGFYPIISAIAAMLAKTTEIRLFADSLINKLPEKPTSKGVVGWHSDKAYWPTCTSNRMLTAWIPLQDCTEDMGPLTHINQSHLWKDDKSLKSFFSFNNQDLSNFESYLENQKKDYVKTKMTLKKGQVSFHNCNTIHSSFPNTSNKSRLALAIHFQDKSNRYQQAFRENGELIELGYDKICSRDELGKPNYRDYEIFPVIFRTKS